MTDPYEDGSLPGAPPTAPPPEPAPERAGVDLRTVMVTVVLIVANCAAYLTQWRAAAADGVSVGTAIVQRDLGGLYAPWVADGDWWRIVSAGFLHGSLIHLAMNMWMLWVVGSILEAGIGPVPFALAYAASVVWGSVGALYLDPLAVTVGASGGVFGVMGALLVIAYRRGVRQLTHTLLITIGINLVFTFAVPGISIGGHVGGLVAGALAGWLLSGRPTRGRVPVPGAAAVVALCIAGVVAGILVAHQGAGDTTVVSYLWTAVAHG